MLLLLLSSRLGGGFKDVVRGAPVQFDTGLAKRLRATDDLHDLGGD
jgi:hypothetical protein